MRAGTKAGPLQEQVLDKPPSKDQGQMSAGLPPGDQKMLAGQIAQDEIQEHMRRQQGPLTQDHTRCQLGHPTQEQT